MIQGSEEWLAERRTGISSTDLPAILGLSPFRSEADVAREKMGEARTEPDARSRRRMAIGLAVEDVIRAEDELEHGLKLRRVAELQRHPTLTWAMTSLDFERVDERCIVETKNSHARRWDDGLPQDVEAQVRWQMGVAGYPKAHVVALRYGAQLECFDLEHDEETWLGLVAIAEDFRRRLDLGGPFTESLASVNRAWPSDAGTDMLADADLIEAVHRLLELRLDIKRAEEVTDKIETAIKTKMADHATLSGPDFRVSWKRTRDVPTVAWHPVAASYRRLIDELREWLKEGRVLEVQSRLSSIDLDAIESLFTSTRAGSRPFRITTKGDPE